MGCKGSKSTNVSSAPAEGGDQAAAAPQEQSATDGATEQRDQIFELLFGSSDLGRVRGECLRRGCIHLYDHLNDII
ncbi:hypothetical protein Btru_029545 [Bulinus truncatus]|nr:hypothetical protein Btru_029545 [Bulinus truncatus]